MATEVEKLENQIAELSAKKIQFEKKVFDARQRQGELQAKRNALLAEIADGDSGARKTLTALDHDVHETAQNVEAFNVAVSVLTSKLTEARIALQRAQDVEAAASLESEIKDFSVLDAELQAALAVVSEKSAALVQRVNAVGARLTLRDEKKYGHLAPQLTQEIRRSVFFFFEEMNKPNAKARPTFTDSTALGMRRIVGELQFELVGRAMQPARGEKAYVVLVACPGVANVDARVGDIVALRPDDQLTVELLRSGTIALHAAEQVA